MYQIYDPTVETIPTDWMKEEVSTGTTIMAAEFNGGVVVGSDSRTTSGTYIANPICNKLSHVAEYIYLCRSGSSAITQAVADFVSLKLNMLVMEGEEPVSVMAAANTLRQVVYGYSFDAGFICAGWDRKNGGQVYSVRNGMLARESCCVGGSGSVYIYGFIDEHFKPNMTKEECMNFVTKAIRHAMWRDGSSGGVVRLVVVTGEGIENQIVVGDGIVTGECFKKKMVVGDGFYL